MPTVKGRWANLMFSQRKNPYCDLLKNMGAKVQKRKYMRKFMRGKVW